MYHLLTGYTYYRPMPKGFHCYPVQHLWSAPASTLTKKGGAGSGLTGSSGLHPAKNKNEAIKSRNENGRDTACIFHLLVNLFVI
jgi:hypothetical protein